MKRIRATRVKEPVADESSRKTTLRSTIILPARGRDMGQVLEKMRTRDHFAGAWERPRALTLDVATILSTSAELMWAIGPFRSRVVAVRDGLEPGGEPLPV
jgi:hypothetical protein